jgi:uncharacterized membrane protein
MTSLDSSQPGGEPDVSRTSLDQRSIVWWGAALIACLAGVAFTTIQILEKIAILKDPFTTLSCDVNETLSCSSVLMAWQSSVLGPPNALIGAIMFAVLGSAAFAGLLGSDLRPGYVATMWGLAVFFLCFASWFMFETAFSIGALCLWCTGITTAIVVICAALTRVADRSGALGDGAIGRTVAVAVRTRVDLLVWGGWWVILAGLVWVGLAS